MGCNCGSKQQAEEYTVTTPTNEVKTFTSRADAELEKVRRGGIVRKVSS